MITELDWGMLRRAVEDSMDLRRDTLDMPEQDVRIFCRLASDPVATEPLARPDYRWLSG